MTAGRKYDFPSILFMVKTENHIRRMWFSVFTTRPPRNEPESAWSKPFFSAPLD
jgi:hypothetical protein